MNIAKPKVSITKFKMNNALRGVLTMTVPEVEFCGSIVVAI